jgi:hypothetical protein
LADATAFAAADADKDDFRLKSEPPVFQLNFKPIPVEKIGVYESPLRASWPIDESRRQES